MSRPLSDLQNHGAKLPAVPPWFGDAAMPQPNETATVIGKRLADLRKEKGITQKQLADRLGLTQPMVSEYERGSLRLHGEMIIQITEILGISADDLLGRTKIAPRPKSGRLMKRLQQIDQLPKRDQDAVLRTIDAFLSKAS